MNPTPSSEWISAYIDGELSLEDVAIFEQALAQDADLRRQLDELQSVRQMVKGLPTHAAPVDLVARIQSQIESSSAPSGRSESAETSDIAPFPHSATPPPKGMAAAISPSNADSVTLANPQSQQLLRKAVGIFMAAAALMLVCLIIDPSSLRIQEADGLASAEGDAGYQTQRNQTQRNEAQLGQAPFEQESELTVLEFLQSQTLPSQNVDPAGARRNRAEALNLRGREEGSEAEFESELKRRVEDQDSTAEPLIIPGGSASGVPDAAFNIRGGGGFGGGGLDDGGRSLDQLGRSGYGRELSPADGPTGGGAQRFGVESNSSGALQELPNSGRGATASPGRGGRGLHYGDGSASRPAMTDESARSESPRETAEVGSDVSNGIARQSPTPSVANAGSSGNAGVGGIGGGGGGAGVAIQGMTLPPQAPLRGGEVVTGGQLETTERERLAEATVRFSSPSRASVNQSELDGLIIALVELPPRIPTETSYSFRSGERGLRRQAGDSEDLPQRGRGQTDDSSETGDENQLRYGRQSLEEYDALGQQGRRSGLLTVDELLQDLGYFEHSPVFSYGVKDPEERFRSEAYAHSSAQRLELSNDAISEDEMRRLSESLGGQQPSRQQRPSPQPDQGNSQSGAAEISANPGSAVLGSTVQDSTVQGGAVQDGAVQSDFAQSGDGQSESIRAQEQSMGRRPSVASNRNVSDSYGLKLSLADVSLGSSGVEIIEIEGDVASVKELLAKLDAGQASVDLFQASLAKNFSASTVGIGLDQSENLARGTESDLARQDQGTSTEADQPDLLYSGGDTSRDRASQSKANEEELDAARAGDFDARSESSFAARESGAEDELSRLADDRRLVENETGFSLSQEQTAGLVPLKFFFRAPFPNADANEDSEIDRLELVQLTRELLGLQSLARKSKVVPESLLSALTAEELAEMDEGPQAQLRGFADEDRVRVRLIITQSTAPASESSTEELETENSSEGELPNSSDASEATGNSLSSRDRSGGSSGQSDPSRDDEH